MSLVDLHFGLIVPIFKNICKDVCIDCFIFSENENGDARRELDESFKILASRENDGKFIYLFQII